MTGNRRFVLISVDQANPTQIALIHQAVKKDAVAWWHQQTGVWIVETDDNVGTWRDRVTPFVRGLSGSVLVLRLPDEAKGRAWASNNLSANWLRSTYGPSGTSGGSLRELMPPDTKRG